MAVAYLILLLLVLSGAGCRFRGFQDGFLGKEQSTAIKGVFILAVFISHVLVFLSGKGYPSDHFLDAVAERIQGGLSQLVVVMFLFYSGYGVMESIKTRGDGYLAVFPRKRLLGTLANFDVAVLVFIALDLLLGMTVTPLQAALAFAGWRSVGIHNWYIFVILCCYGATYAAFRLLPGRRTTAAWVVPAALLAILLVLSVLKGAQHWWYDTILCYPAGMAYSFHKERVVAFCQRHYWWILVLLAGAFAFLARQSFLPECRGLTYNLEAIVFALLVVQATMKVRIGNRVLGWFGDHLFPIFVYHQLPMFCIDGILGGGWIAAHPYWFMAASFAGTCAIAHCYRYWQIKL